MLRSTFTSREEEREVKLISDNVWRRTNQKKVVLSSTLRTVGHASLLSRGHTRSARALLSPRNPRTSSRFTSHGSDVVDAREHDDDEYLRCALCAVRLMANADGGLVAPCGLARPNHAHAKLAKQTALRAAPSLSNSAPLSRVPAVFCVDKSNAELRRHQPPLLTMAHFRMSACPTRPVRLV